MYVTTLKNYGWNLEVSMNSLFVPAVWKVVVFNGIVNTVGIGNPFWGKQSINILNKGKYNIGSHSCKSFRIL